MLVARYLDDCCRRYPRSLTEAWPGDSLESALETPKAESLLARLLRMIFN